MLIYRWFDLGGSSVNSNRDIGRRWLVQAATVLSLARVSGMPAREPEAESACLEGTVTDPDGEPVIEAAVRLQNVMTRQVSVAVTSRNGAYLFDGVRAGRYSLWVRAPSGDSIWVREIVLNRGDCRRRDFQFTRAVRRRN
jgi:protocatechuate 3,4-dioxygenase beta subunit